MTNLNFQSQQIFNRRLDLRTYNLQFLIFLSVETIFARLTSHFQKKKKRKIIQKNKKVNAPICANLKLKLYLKSQKCIVKLFFREFLFYLLNHFSSQQKCEMANK